jgi:uncharacterized protein
MTLFEPFQPLADLLLPHAFSGDDGAHDVAHLARVWKNVKRIQAGEGGDLELLAAATLLHDCVAMEKNDPRRAEASTLAAAKATAVLSALGWEKGRVEAVAHAIAAHSFSANILPGTLEAQILQDADRLDALGMVGVARTFYIGGRMGTALYNVDEPVAQSRALNDKVFAIDHFHVKLLKLAEGFSTKTGQTIAAVRHARLERFLAEFMDEV